MLDLVYPHLVKLDVREGLVAPDGCHRRCEQGVTNSVADFDRAEIEQLIADAVKLAKLRLDPNAKGAMIIKAEAQKQRARRAAKAARPASARPAKMRQSKKSD